MNTGSAGRFGQDSRQRRFPAARRAPKYQRPELSRTDNSTEKPARTEQVLLANKLVHCRRTHSVRWWSAIFACSNGLRFKQSHAFMLAQPNGLVVDRHKLLPLESGQCYSMQKFP